MRGSAGERTADQIAQPACAPRVRRARASTDQRGERKLTHPPSSQDYCLSGTSSRRSPSSEPRDAQLATASSELTTVQYSTPARSSAACTTQRQPFRSTVQQSARAPLLQPLEERLQFPGAQSAAMLPTLRSAARWLTTSNHAHRSFARSPSRAQGGGSIAAGHRSVRRTAGRTQRPAPRRLRTVRYELYPGRYPILTDLNRPS